MLELYRSLNIVRVDQLDTQPLLLNVANGVLDLATGDLRAHDPAYRMTKATEVVYEPDATCPTWEAWLRAQMDGDTERVEFLRCMFGDSLRALAGRRKFFYFFGPSGTGKTTITKLVLALLGEYGASIKFETLSQQNNTDGGRPRPDIRRLQNKRVIAATESHEKHKLDDALIKQFVGGDKISPRTLHQEEVEFAIVGLLVLSGNAAPAVDADESFWTKALAFPRTWPAQAKTSSDDNIVATTVLSCSRCG